MCFACWTGLKSVNPAYGPGAGDPARRRRVQSRGNALQNLNRPAEALASFDRALALDPRNIQALYKRGVMLTEMGRSDEALQTYDRLLALAPNHAETLNNRGYLWWLNRQQWAPAIADLEKALILAPDLPYGQGAVLHLKMYAADWRDFGERKAELFQGVRREARVARPFMFQALSDNPADLQVCARLYARDLYPQVPSPPHERRARDKIRLGYLSGEFRDQATAILMAGLYERHDRNRFEVIAVDNGSADDSPMSARLRRAFDGWLDIGGLTDQAATRKIRDARIDILVNLNGWFGKHRTGVCRAAAGGPSSQLSGFSRHSGRALYGLHYRRSSRDPAGQAPRFWGEKVIHPAGQLPDQ